MVRSFQHFLYHLFLKTWITLNFKFFRKDCFFNRCLKNFKRNSVSRIVEIHNNITVKIIAINGLVWASWMLFRVTEKKVLHWGEYLLVPLWIIWILLVSVVPTLVKYLLVFLQFRILFYYFLLSFYSPWGRNISFFVSLLFFNYLPCLLSIVFVFT